MPLFWQLRILKSILVLQLMRVLAVRALFSCRNQVQHPVSYFSMKFNRHQQVYSTIEKEALALVLVVQHFEIYLGSIAAPIIIYTDHNPLVFLNRMRNRNQRLMRWSLILQPFHLEIKHIRGKDNVIADTFSRA